MPAALDVCPPSVTTTGFADGLGRRSIRFDRESGTTLECLHVRPELAAFEHALRMQTQAITGLDDERLVRVHGFERNDGRLVIVSELLAGDRLSDVIEARAAGESAVSGIDAAFGFLLQLLPALSAMHSVSVVHGALAPGRIMLTTSAQVVIADVIYGTALPRLNLSRHRLWSELGVAVPPSVGAVRLDASSDVAQAALAALMLALGRSVTGVNPGALTALVREVAEIAQIRGGESLAERVREFFASTLPMAGRRSEVTAAQAAADVRAIVSRKLGENTCLAALADFARYDAPQATNPPSAVRRSAAIAVPVAVSPTVAPSPEPVAAPAPPIIAEPVRPTIVTTRAPNAPVPAPPTPVSSSPETTVRIKAEPPTGYGPPRLARILETEPPVDERRFSWKLAAAAVAILTVGTLAGRAYLNATDVPVGSPVTPTATTSKPAAPLAVSTGILSISSQPSGARVLLNGAAAGRTPLRLDAVTAGRHTITLVTDTMSVKRTVRVGAGKTVAIDIPVLSGWITVFAPIVLDVSEGSRTHGTTAQGRILLSPGRHTLTLSHREFGYSTVQQVDVVAGEQKTLTLTPTGLINLNAQPWAEVWIDGAKAGETPLANLQVALGRREIVFKHPQYGERRVTTTITSTTSALSVDLTKPSFLP